MVEKIDAGQGISGLTITGPTGRANAPATATSETGHPDATLEIKSPISNINTTAPSDDPEKVQRARQLIANGQLDTPENIRSAAANILQFGW